MPKVRRKAMFGIEPHAKKSLKTQNQEGVEKQGGNGGAIQNRKCADVVAAANTRGWDASLDWFVA
jgi:hypothetical protein